MEDMVLDWLGTLSVVDTLTVAAVGSDYEGPFFWLLGPLGGIGFYTAVYLRYRNTDKRFAYEHHTEAKLSDLRGHDRKVGAVRGVSNRTIQGENASSPTKRLGAATTVTDPYAQQQG